MYYEVKRSHIDAHIKELQGKIQTLKKHLGIKHIDGKDKLELDKVKQNLGTSNANKNAAKAILKLID